MTLTLFSQYFNPKISKSMGRRIPIGPARNFSDNKLEEILRSLNFHFEVREGAYPRIPWEKCKIYVIDANVKKSTLLKLIERRLG